MCCTWLILRNRQNLRKETWESQNRIDGPLVEYRKRNLSNTKQECYRLNRNCSILNMVDITFTPTSCNTWLHFRLLAQTKGLLGFRLHLRCANVSRYVLLCNVRGMLRDLWICYAHGPKWPTSLIRCAGLLQTRRKVPRRTFAETFSVLPLI